MKPGARKFVFFLLLLGLSYIAYVYMIAPANRRLASKRASLDGKLMKLSEFERANAKVESLSKQMSELEEAIEFFETQLPPTSEIDNVLKQLTVIAQKANLRPKTIRTLQQKNNSGYVEQVLKMEVVGDFPSFYTFLLSVEKLSRIIKTRELRLDKKGSDSDISADFIMSVFFQNANS